MAKLSTDKVYSAKQIAKKEKKKTVMMLDNRNIQVSTLKINGRNIITLLNKLPYLFNSRHPKSTYMHVVTKLIIIQNRL